MRRIPVAILRRIASRLSLSGQEGSLLIEVMVGAVLVVSVSAAVLDGLNGAQDTGQRNRARTVSASLAQQDQERLRSKPVVELSNYRQTRSLEVANVEYEIRSRSDWVNDASGVVSCTNASTQAQYMRLSTSVSSDLNQTTPVTQTSLVSPPRGAFGPNEGTIAVKVVDRAENPLEGVRVDLSGPRNLSDVTNDLGCVVFGYIPKGSYMARTTSLGLVGTDGSSPYEVGVNVIGGSTVLQQIALDRPATIIASFETKLGAAAPVPVVDGAMRIANSRLPSPGSRLFTTSPPALAITADKVFPFLDGYGVYAGNCHEANNPGTYDEDYYTKPPGDQAFVAPDPGDVATATVRIPAINVQVQESSGANSTLPRRVFVTADDPPNCTTAYPMQWSTAVGALPAPAFPYGEYKVCADNNLSGSSGRRTPTTQAVVRNVAPNGTAIQNLRMSTSGSLCAPRTP